MKVYVQVLDGKPNLGENLEYVCGRSTAVTCHIQICTCVSYVFVVAVSYLTLLTVVPAHTSLW